MSATLSPVQVPDIGDFADVPVIELLVSVGDRVAAEDPLVTLESDKATMDVPAPFGGIVREIEVAVGDRVSEGAVLMTVEPDEGNGASDPGHPAQPEPAEQAAAVDRNSAPRVMPAEELEAPESDTSADAQDRQPGGGSEALDPIYASPSVRRLARERGVDLRAVQGTGRRGRITAEDVERLGASAGGPVALPGSPGPAGPAGPAGASAGAGAAGALGGLPPWPSPDFAKFGEVERVPRSRIQRISAPNLARNWVMIPHVTHHDEADITELEAWRKQLNQEHAREAGAAKFTMVSFLVAASVVALKEFPQFNSSLDGDELVLKRYYNIGFAADTPQGLVVPVIKGADAKGLREIALELAALSGKAREGKLGPADMSGSTFTISSLGGIGGTAFTPIVNAPEVAILGATRAAIKPVWGGSEFEPRLMLPLSLSYDHRVIDGAAAARFCAFLARVLTDLRRALL